MISSLAAGEAIRITRDKFPDLIIGSSNNRDKKDKYNREKDISRLRKSVSAGKLTKAHSNNRGYNTFLSIEKDIHQDGYNI